MGFNDAIPKLIHGHSNNGTSYVDLEFCQNTITKTGGANTHGFHSTGPDGGRTVGDLKITLEYTGNGSFTPVSYQQWQPASSAESYNYFPITPPASPKHAAGIGFKIRVPYGAFDSTVFDPLQYVEGAIDLIALIGGKGLPGESGSLPFKTLIIKSKSSASNIYDLKDFSDSIVSFSLDISIDKKTIIDISSSANEKLIAHFLQNPHKMKTMDRRLFEELIAEIFDGFGFSVELTQRTRDGGRDIIAIKNAETKLKYLIECKRPDPGTIIGIKPVRELFGVKSDEKASKAILATTSYFSKDATLFFERNKWELEPKDFDGIMQWIEEYKRKKNIASFPAESPQGLGAI
jgi:HJR/Mrr/RecB family endonuclease